MNKSRPFILLVIAAAACIIAGSFSATIRGSSKVYEIRPQINIPEYQMYPLNTTAVYQQMLEQQRAATEERLSAISINLETIANKLDAIDSKITQISARLTKIEDALGIKPPPVPDTIAVPQKAADQNQIKPVLPAKE